MRNGVAARVLEPNFEMVYTVKRARGAQGQFASCFYGNNVSALLVVATRLLEAPFHAALETWYQRLADPVCFAQFAVTPLSNHALIN